MIMNNLLSNKLEEIRNTRATFNAGLKLAVEFVLANNGAVSSYDDWGTYMTVVTLGDEESHIFQPYADIDLFCFEI